jgi:4-amino-4-deoxy-L-arabinose transferase-like glycosyltransferase
MSTTTSPSDPVTFEPPVEAPVSVGWSSPSAPRRSFLQRLLLGGGDQPAWARPAFIALLIATAAFYFYNLTASGYANDFYAAAVQAGTKSWKAFFFGSSDWSNAITVDKTPGSLWPMEIFGRIFGFSSWSMLAPNVLEGVASVALLHCAIKRWFGAAAGLLAGLVLALTPVAALMFRFNNPDAALVFLLVAASYCMTRAIESARARWMILTGVCLGFGFLAKELQAMLVVPGLALAYLIAAPTALRKRLVHLVVGLGAMIVSAGWWLAIASLWPASSRPFFGGSRHNSILEVIMGGNGLDRITGGSGGPGGGTGGGGANFSGAAGWGRLFNSLMGGQISWLLPASLIALVIGLAFTLRSPRTNRARAALILWGGWFVVTAITLSFMTGTVHTYYTVALAPAVAALLGIVTPRLWQSRSTLLSRFGLSSMLLSTGVWSYVLLDRTPSWHPWIRIAVVALCAVAIAGLWLESILRRFVPRVAMVIGVAALVGSLLGPAAYSAETVSTAHTGSIPSAGPSTGNAMGAFGGNGGGRSPRDGGGFGGFSTRSFSPGAGSGFPGSPPTNQGSSAQGSAGGGLGQAPTGTRSGGFGGMGANNVSSSLVKVLQANASKYRWAAATVGSQSSAGLQLASDVPVMDIGGFTGSDPSPTLAQFESYVAKGEIHYFIAGGGGMGGGGMGGFGGHNSDTSSITSWVESHFTAQTIGNQTVYDLTAPTSSGAPA